MTNLYLIKLQNLHIYHLVESVNITRYLTQLDRLCHEPIDLRYRVFPIRPDYLTTLGLTDTEPGQLVTLLAKTFPKLAMKPGWFRLVPDQLTQILHWISKIMEPVQAALISDDAQYQCNHCYQSFPTKRLFTIHLEQCQNNFICTTCNKSFCNYKRYQNHTAKCTPLVCQLCHKKFASKQSLATHQRNCGNFSCSICQTNFTSKHKYQLHLKNHLTI